MLLNTSECICCNNLAKFPQSIKNHLRKCELCKDEKHLNSQRVCCYKTKNDSGNVTTVRFEKVGKNWKGISINESSNNPIIQRKSARLSSVPNKVNTQDKTENNINLRSINSQLKRKISETDRFPRDKELKMSRIRSEIQNIHKEKVNNSNIHSETSNSIGRRVSELRSKLRSAEKVEEQSKKDMLNSINNENEKIDTFQNNSVNNNFNRIIVTRQSLSYNIDEKINKKSKTKVESIFDTLPIGINICTDKEIKGAVKEDIFQEVVNCEANSEVFSENITSKTFVEEEKIDDVLNKLCIDNKNEDYNSLLNENISTKESVTNEKENIDLNLVEEIKDNDFCEIIVKDREDDRNALLKKGTIEFTLEETKNSENNENLVIDAEKEKKHTSLSISCHETFSEKADINKDIGIIANCVYNNNETDAIVLDEKNETEAMTLIKEQNISQDIDKLRKKKDIIGEIVFKEEERLVSVKEVNETIVDCVNNEDDTIGIQEEIIYQDSEEMEEIVVCETYESGTCGIEEKETPEIIDEYSNEDIREEIVFTEPEEMERNESTENMRNDVVENGEMPRATALRGKEEKDGIVDDKIKVKLTATVSDSFSEFEFSDGDVEHDYSNGTESLNKDCDPKVNSVYDVPTETQENLDNNTSQLIDCDGNNLVKTMEERKENLSLAVELFNGNSCQTIIVPETEEDILEDQEIKENIDCYDENDDNDDSKTEEMRNVTEVPTEYDLVTLLSEVNNKKSEQHRTDETDRASKSLKSFFECHLCSETFDSRSQLDTHSLIHNLDAKDFVASTSSTYSNNVTEQMTALKIKNDVGRQKFYKCEICDRVFYKPHAYSGHYGTHKREIKEKIIAKERNNPSEEREKEKISNEKKNKEKLCLKEKKWGQRKEENPKDDSNQENSTVEGVSVGGSAGSFVCLHCRGNKSFSNENELTYHVMRQCEGVKEYLKAELNNMKPGTVGCSICGLMFDTGEALTDHKNNIHASKNSELI